MIANEKQPCPKDCPKIKNFPGYSETGSDLFPAKVRYKTGPLPIDFDEHWELISLNRKHTTALAKTQEEAMNFRNGIDVCTGPKEFKVFGITLFRKCQNPNKPL